MKFKYYFLLPVLMLLISCKKDFLEAKPDKSLVVPSTLADFQALLDNTDIMNSAMPYLGEISSDEYYLQYDTWNALTHPPEKNGYIWAKEIYEGTPSYDWEYMYRIVFYANNVLEGLEKIKNTDDPRHYNELKGSALFFRAYAFYQLSQLFCAPYSASSSNDGPGIPLRLQADINLPSKRASIADSYTRIIDDLTASTALLPLAVLYKTRPCKTAAYVMLSKVYLVMQDYSRSLLYADSALMQPTSQLMDFNKLNTLASYPVGQYNEEVIFQTTLDYATCLSSSRLNIDTVLYSSYSDSDLRKTTLFTLKSGRLVFKGNYNGSSPYYFSGLALDEVYLNKAECLARRGKVQEAMNVLNMLLIKRYRSGSFSPLTASSGEAALQLVLQERRKELLFRGIRWSDLRRLNLDPSTSKTLHRLVGGQTYELLPNSPNYVFAIEDNVIHLSGMAQNTRN